MPEEQPTDEGRVLLSWPISEYEKHQRSWRWYLAAGIIVLILSGLSIFTPNFLFDTPNYLFLIIIILSAVIMIVINALSEEVDFTLTTEGIIIGGRFYDYDRFKDFCVIYKPRENLKVLYLEFSSRLRPRLSVSLQNANPLEVREILLNFLPEDLNRTDESNTDFFSRWFKV